MPKIYQIRHFRQILLFRQICHFYCTPLFRSFPGIQTSGDPIRSFTQILTSREIASNLHLRQIRPFCQILHFRGKHLLRSFARVLTSGEIPSNP